MHVLPLFSSFLASEIIPSIDNDSLVEGVQAMEAQSDLRYDGGWQSGFIDPHNTCIAPVSQAVEQRIHGVCSAMGIRADVAQETRINSCWINVQDSHSLYGTHANPPHQHHNNFVSFVYYAKALPRAGDLVLIGHNPIQEWSLPSGYLDTNNVYNSSRWSIRPEPGLLVAFPAWCMHMVEHNLSGDTRISIAYNVALPHQQFEDLRIR